MINPKQTGGGPAFPNNSTDWRDIPNHPAPGMTLRDYFAAAALQGVMASATPPTLGAVAIICYGAADAMLAARGEGAK